MFISKKKHLEALDQERRRNAEIQIRDEIWELEDKVKELTTRVDYLEKKAMK